MWQDKQVAHTVDVVHRSDDVLLSEPVTFDELLLSKPVLNGLKKSGFNKPSPIQLKAIPLGRCGLDLVVQAKSGTGKTCVFTVIALDVINVQSTALQVMILAPTREIALQVHGVVSCIGQDLQGLSAQVFIGGTLVSDDRIKAKKCHIAIGSPGRLKQLIELGILDTKCVRIFVLDEADKLVEEGSFQKQINWIYSTLPINKQMLALSATYPEELANFLTKYMREPTFVRLDASHPSLLGLRQYYRVVYDCNLPHLLFEQKAKEVIQLLSNVTFQQALIFSNYHSRAESICEALSSNGWPSAYISGNMEQSRRTEAINKLKQFKCRVLISTDLTSRGIDAQNVNLVINMDVPFDWETYMHRIGRAGRFGSRGIAVSLVGAGEEETKLQSIAAQCNATILPLHDVTKDCEILKQNNSSYENETMTPTPLIELSQGDSKAQDSKNNYLKFPAKVQSEPNVSVCQDFKSPDSTDSCSSDNDVGQSRESKPVSSNEEDSSSRESSRVGDDFFDRVFCENTSLPPIPSLKELMSRTEHLRKNRHYLDMSYKDIKADFEHFAKTGEFNGPQEASSCINELESKLACLSTNSTNEPAICSDNIHKARGSVVPPPLNNRPKSSNVETTLSLPSNIQETTTVSPRKIKQSKPKSDSKQHNYVKVVRKRHPQSAAAGLDSLKHWTDVEKVNTSLSATFPAHEFKPLEQEKTSFATKENDVASDGSFDDDSSSDEFESFTEDTSSDSEDSEESSSDSAAVGCDYSYQCEVPPPPVLYQFGPTGHCFNPLLCPHPNMEVFDEAVAAHQVYHHALAYARYQVFRVFK